MAAPLPKTEDARLAALRDCRLLDTAPDPAFDDLALLASQICETPIAAVSLVDADRQWFKSIVGLKVSETSRETAFCAHTILEPDVLVVPDATVDDRFSANPLVTGDPHIRFYAGAPLVMADGHALGSLCVIDRVPRQLAPAQKAALGALARQTARQIEAGQRETALQHSEAKFRAIIDASPIPYALNDERQNITFLNAEFLRTFGYTPEDIPTLADWWPKAYPDPSYREWVATTWQARLEKADREGTAFEPLELTIRCKDGADRTVLASAAALGSSLDGTHLVILYDITERKRIEEDLRESKQFVESVTDHSSNIIFVFDLDAQANVYANRSVGEFLGYSNELVQDLGENLLPAMIFPDDMARVQAHFARFDQAADGEVVEIEYRARHASGEWRWIWNREVVFKRHPNGRPRQIMGTAHDITERKLAQEETARLAAILESSHDAVLGMTLDGTLVAWNDAAETLYGYNAGEVIGQHASVLAPPEERGFVVGII
ncbi:MAG: PAS domain S-box protein, partial [Armatimonadota bacterium]|nr:PAS domain S-box protein [Armatimonadota bacterium]